MGATISDSVGFKGKNLSKDVCTIQDLMDLPVTGDCNDDLIDNIKKFQQNVIGLQGKSIDGRIDPGGVTLRTLIKSDFERWGVASPPVLTEEDLKAGAVSLNLEAALIKAVADVESMGAGFLPSGKPTILFERHVFSQLTSNKHDATHPAISQVSPGGWGAKGEHQYGRLYEAMACDREAALRSASWGRFQILGDSYKWAGSATVDAFVDAMRESEQQHLTAFLNYIKNKGSCLSHLKNKKWTPFAQNYNGPGEASDPGGPYHERLEEAYNAIIAQQDKAAAAAIGNVLSHLAAGH